MGATKRAVTNRYYNINNGQFVQRVKDGTEGAEVRVNKTGKSVSELIFDTIEGRLKRVYTYEHQEFGTMLCIEVADDSGTDVIESTLKSVVMDSFLTRVGNVDFKETMKLRPYSFIPKGEEKEKKGMSIFQGVDEKGKDKKVESVFTKEKPGKLPQLKEMKKKGKKSEWDSTDRQEFWIDYVVKINEKIQGAVEVITE